MNRSGHKDARYFVGTEIEHTPAAGLKTLFVVGIQPAESILSHAQTNQVEHIYFGANQSFPMIAADDYSVWHAWEVMVLQVLQDERNYMCTLDIDVTCVEGLVESMLVEHGNFIPMISVKLPYMKLLGYNATVKLDDRDFAATNPGVWCHNLRDLQNRDRYTAWSGYTKDTVIE